jgi:general stress protein YciG
MLMGRMKESRKHVREYLAEIGRRGGEASRRQLTKSHARQMVDVREAKRAALRAGKPWPPRDRKALKLLKLT